MITKSSLTSGVPFWYAKTDIKLNKNEIRQISRRTILIYHFQKDSDGKKNVIKKGKITPAKPIAHMSNSLILKFIFKRTNGTGRTLKSTTSAPKRNAETECPASCRNG